MFMFSNVFCLALSGLDQETVERERERGMPRVNDDTALTGCSVPSDQEENVHLSNDRRCGFKTVALISESHDDQPIRQLFVACPLPMTSSTASSLHIGLLNALQVSFHDLSM